MNVRETAELALWVSRHSQFLIEAETPLSDEAIQHFWTAWQVGIGGWMRQLYTLARGTAGWRTLAGRRHAKALMAQVLASEMLARITAATLVAADQSRDEERCGPVARNVLHAQVTATHVVLQLLVEGRVVSETSLRALYRLRRRVERWTDLLLGHMIHRRRIEDFVFERRRAWEFGCEFSGESERAEASWELARLGLHVAFQSSGRLTPALLQQNSRMGVSVVDLFPSGVLTSEAGAIVRMAALARLPQAAGQPGSRRWGFRERHRPLSGPRPPFLSRTTDSDRDGTRDEAP